MIQLHQIKKIYYKATSVILRKPLQHRPPTHTHLHKQTSRILRVFPILIAATLFCACSSEIAQDFSSFKDMCEASGGTYVSNNNKCKCSEIDCSDGVICVEGKCASECESGKKKCTPGNSNTNTPASVDYCVSGRWGNVNLACKTSYCKGDETDSDCDEPLGCNAGIDKKCAGDDSWIFCDENGKWSDALRCPDICDAQTNKCKSTECNDNKLKCANDKDHKYYFVCNNGTWDTDNPKPCSENEVCQNDKCVPAQTPNTCTDGQTQCEGNILKTCENGAWIEKECTNGCENKACKPEKECDGEAKQCSSDKTKVEICKDGHWTQEQECTDGECSDEGGNPHCTNTCTHGNKRCTDDKKSWQECNSEKEWNEAKPCPDDKPVCVNGECQQCTDGEKKCEENTAYICRNGSWGDGTLCNNDCKNGECKPQIVCEENAKKCNDDSTKVQTCTNNQWVEEKSCSPGNCTTDGGQAHCASTPISNCNETYDFQCVKDEQSHEYYYRVCDESLSWKNTICYSQETPGVVECTNTTINKCGCDTFCQDGSDSYNHLKCQNDKFCISDKDIKITKLINDYKLDNAIINKILPCGNFSDVQLQPCSTAPECSGDMKKCESNKAYECKDGHWVKVKDCENGCDSKKNDCFPECDPSNNNAEGYQCKDDKHYQKCTSEGKWDLLTVSSPCGNDQKCFDGICYNKLGSTCTDADNRCEDKIAKICLSGELYNIQCPNSCNEGKCGCKSRTKKCNEEGKIQTCENGIWSSPQECLGAVSAGRIPLICSNNACKSCDEDGFACNNGKYYSCPSSLVPSPFANCVDTEFNATSCKDNRINHCGCNTICRDGSSKKSEIWLITCKDGDFCINKIIKNIDDEYNTFDDNKNVVDCYMIKHALGSSIPNC